MRNYLSFLIFIILLTGTVYGLTPAADTQGYGNILYFLLMAYIGGLLLNLMPCVLPVISLKIFSFIESAGEDKKKVFKSGLAFTVGVLFSFIILASAIGILKFFGQSVGWGFQFQSPYYVLGLIIVIFVFALSLFDLFEISAPGVNKLDKLAGKKGYGGSFFEGILTVLLATPCSAPFLGTALSFAFIKPLWVIFIIFFTIGLGLATPYLLLSANPGWMSFLPKPGNWMIKLRTSMGFLLLGTVCWLLWVLGLQQDARAVVSTVAFLIFIAFAVWLLSLIEYKSTLKIKWIIRISSLIVLAGGIIFCYTWLYPWKEFAGGEKVVLNTTSEVVNGVSWHKYTPEAFELARKSGKVIFLDISAEWCATCKYNENTVLYSNEVSKRLSLGDIIAFKGDNTKRTHEITSLMKSLKRSAVPVYAIYPQGENSSPQLLPEVITIPMVLEGINKVAGTSKE